MMTNVSTNLSRTNVSVFNAPARSEPAIEMDTLRRPLALNVDVLSGVHSGVSQRIEGGEAVIGSDGASDVILFVDRLAPRHVAIAPKSAFGSTVVVKAIDGSVTLDSGAVLEPGQWAEASMPLDMALRTADGDGTHVTVSRTITPAEFAKPALAAVTALALIIIGPNLVGSAFSSVERSVTAPAVVAPASPVQVAEASGDIVESLRGRVVEAGLGHLVAVTAGGDGTVLVSGDVAKADGNKWRRILRWYDQQPRAPGLVNAVKVGTAPAMPEIASVWLLGEPEITLANGRKLREGDKARGGWTVKVISAEGVILSRNGSDVTVTF